MTMHSVTSHDVSSRSVSSQSASSHSVSSQRNTIAARPAASSLGGRLLDTVRLWRKRMRTRRELAYLSYADLRDIGYPAAVQAEIHKPFWRA
jgi:uncharacterized protein YjiS (DUF1127 family)